MPTSPAPREMPMTRGERVMMYAVVGVFVLLFLMMLRDCFIPRSADDRVLRSIAYYFPNNKLTIDTQGPVSQRHYSYTVHDVPRAGRLLEMRADREYRRDQLQMWLELPWKNDSVSYDTLFVDSLIADYTARYGAPSYDKSKWAGQTDTTINVHWQSPHGEIELELFTQEPAGSIYRSQAPRLSEEYPLRP